MPKAPCTYRQSDLARAFRSARDAKVEIERVEIDRQGKITVFVANGSSVVAPRSEEAR